MFQKTLLYEKILVPCHKLHVYKDYIEKKLGEYVNKTHSTKVGYINEIIEIISMEPINILKSDFSGSVLYNIGVYVSNCNPQKGDIIECTIVQNKNVIFGLNKPLRIIIMPTEDSDSQPKVELNQVVRVVVLDKKIKYRSDFIDVASNLVV